MDQNAISCEVITYRKYLGILPIVPIYLPNKKIRAPNPAYIMVHFNKPSIDIIQPKTVANPVILRTLSTSSYSILAPLPFYFLRFAPVSFQILSLFLFLSLSLFLFLSLFFFLFFSLFLSLFFSFSLFFGEPAIFTLYCISLPPLSSKSESGLKGNKSLINPGVLFPLASVLVFQGLCVVGYSHVLAKYGSLIIKTHFLEGFPGKI